MKKNIYPKVKISFLPPQLTLFVGKLLAVSSLCPWGTSWLAPSVHAVFLTNTLCPLFSMSAGTAAAALFGTTSAALFSTLGEMVLTTVTGVLISVMVCGLTVELATLRGVAEFTTVNWPVAFEETAGVTHNVFTFPKGVFNTVIKEAFYRAAFALEGSFAMVLTEGAGCGASGWSVEVGAMEASSLIGVAVDVLTWLASTELVSGKGRVDKTT